MVDQRRENPVPGDGGQGATLRSRDKGGSGEWGDHGIFRYEDPCHYLCPSCLKSGEWESIEGKIVKKVTRADWDEED